MSLAILVSVAALSVFTFCMVHAAISDILSMTIANRVSLGLVAAFLLLAPLAGFGWQAVALHVAAGLTVLLVTFGLFAAGAMGGGDAKLLAATGVWTGFGPPLFEYLMVSAVAGGILTALILVYRRTPLAASTGHYAVMRNFADTTKGIPYGVALCIGGLLSMSQAPLTGWAIGMLAGG